jgi:hypothetical protein
MSSGLPHVTVISYRFLYVGDRFSILVVSSIAQPHMMWAAWR